MSISTFIAEVEAYFETEKTELVATLSAVEKALLPGFEALAKQIEATIGQQGLTILEQGLADIGTVIASGGDVGLAISALVPQVTSQVSDDLKQDATNAAHGAVSLIIAAIPTPEVAPVAPTA